MNNIYVTGYEARDLHGIPLTRIHQWRHTGRATVHGYAARSPLFDPVQLATLNAQAEAHPMAKRSG